MKPLVLVTAPVGTRSGYGSHSRDIVRSLIALDRFDIHVWPVRWGGTPQNALDEKNPKDIPIIQRIQSQPKLDRQPDIHFHIVVPNEFQAHGRFNIGITAGLETTNCPGEWIEGLNRMNLNIVPANFVRNSIEKSTFDRLDERTRQKIGEVRNERPIEVLFEGSDTEIYKPTNEFSKDLVDELKGIEEDWCFLFVGHWLGGPLGHDRKDVGMLVKTFLSTFKGQKKKPALILKTSSATPSIIDREEILKKINDIKSTVSGKDLPNIYVLHGDLDDEEMNGLYNHPKVKAAVSFTHGEGFGRPLLEAALSGKPVIAPNWSGHMDFLDSDAILLPGSLNDVRPESFPQNMYVEGSKWFTVNYNYASKVLQGVFNDYDKHLVKAKKLSIKNQTRFSLDAMTKKLGDLLDKYLPVLDTPAEQVKLNLPKLKKSSGSGPPKSPPKMELPKLKKG